MGISGSSLDVVSTFAGSGNIGMHDGWGKNASFNFPMGIVFDTNNNLYVADSGNNVVRKITSQGFVSTVAGNGTRGYSDAGALYSMFNRPTDVFMTPVGNLLIVDSGNNVIRLVGMVAPPAAASTTSSSTASYTSAAPPFLSANSAIQNSLYLSSSIFSLVYSLEYSRRSFFTLTNSSTSSLGKLPFHSIVIFCSGWFSLSFLFQLITILPSLHLYKLLLTAIPL